MAVTKIHCPHCGKLIAVDDSMGQAFCLFCGQKIILTDDTPEEEPVLGVYEDDAVSRNTPAVDTQPKADGGMPKDKLQKEQPQFKKFSLVRFLKRYFKANKLFVLGLIIGSISVFVGLITLTAGLGKWYIGVVITAIAAIAALIGLRKWIKEKRCKKCKTSFEDALSDGNIDVSYSLIKTSKKTIRINGDNPTYNVETYALYRFEIKCPKCGTINRFDKKILIAKEDRIHGTREEYTVDLEAESGLTELEKDSNPLDFKQKLASFAIFLFFVIAGIVMFCIGIVNAAAGTAKGYNGVYYGIVQENLMTVTISGKKCKVALDNGFEVEEYYDLNYSIIDADRVASVVSHPKYTDKNVLLIEQDEDSGIVLYILDEKPYKFECKGGTLSTTKITLDDYLPDPKDYYGVFSPKGINSNETITLNYDGTADMNIGSYNQDGLKYRYATPAYAKALIDRSYSTDVIIIQLRDGYYVALPYNNGTLMYGNTPLINPAYVSKSTSGIEAGSNQTENKTYKITAGRVGYNESLTQDEIDYYDSLGGRYKISELQNIVNNNVINSQIIFKSDKTVMCSLSDSGTWEMENGKYVLSLADYNIARDEGSGGKMIYKLIPTQNTMIQITITIEAE